MYSQCLRLNIARDRSFGVNSFTLWKCTKFLTGALVSALGLMVFIQVSRAKGFVNESYAESNTTHELTNIVVTMLTMRSAEKAEGISGSINLTKSHWLADVRTPQVARAELTFSSGARPMPVEDCLS